MLSTVAQSSLSPPIHAGPRNLARVWLATAPLAVLGAWIGFDALPGINFPLWIACAVTALLLARRVGSRTRPPLPAAATGLSLLGCALSGVTAITANPVRGSVLAFVVLALLALALQLLAGAPVTAVTPYSLLRLPLTVSRVVVGESAGRAEATLATLRGARGVPYLRALGLASPVCAVLALLLAAADPTLSSWRDLIVDGLSSHAFLLRAIFCLVLAAILLGVYGTALRHAPLVSGPAASQHAVGKKDGVLLSTLERLTVLAGVAVLFALFFALQLSYLFSDVGSRPGNGITFAQATHRGFVQMLLAATISAGVIITVERHAKRGSFESPMRALACLVIAESLLLLASAYERVLFYEAAYGFTVQRLNVKICCVLTAAALLLLAWELRVGLDSSRLCRRGLLVGVLGLAFLAYGDPSAWVVRANLARNASSGRLDVAYLAKLSRDLDAVPDLLRALPQLPAGDAARLRQSLADTARRHAAVLSRHHWYEWNLRRARARAAFEQAGLLAN